MCTKFGVDSSSGVSSRERINRQTDKQADATECPYTACMGNKQ